MIILSRYLWAVRLPPQNSAGTKKLGGRSNARLVKANNQWGMNKTPLIKVSLYYHIKFPVFFL
ncbi:hypothetical protein EXW31_26265 [Bacillus mycoides]|nr:hypothetical protein EXW31_26265 [Bacillus mycoides]QWH15009.1 hypothetical protein EXW38_26575 [Bacillus mycoides]